MVFQYALKLHPQKSHSLCLDRTNWKFGKLDINILTVAYAHEGVAVPLLWCLLPKARNSATQERSALLERLLKLLPLEQLEVLLADREFVGGEWFAYLCEQHLPFVIRVRKDALGDGWFRLFGFFQHLPVGEHKVLKQRYVSSVSRLLLQAHAWLTESTSSSSPTVVLSKPWHVTPSVGRLSVCSKP